MSETVKKQNTDSVSALGAKKYT